MGATSSKKNQNFTERFFMFFFLLKFQPEHSYVILSAYLDSIYSVFVPDTWGTVLASLGENSLLSIISQAAFASLGRVAVTAHCCRSC
jgi:hypothetical protein